jgi:hypothetical protein
VSYTSLTLAALRLPLISNDPAWFAYAVGSAPRRPDLRSIISIKKRLGTAEALE